MLFHLSKDAITQQIKEMREPSPRFFVTSMLMSTIMNNTPLIIDSE